MSLAHVSPVSSNAVALPHPTEFALQFDSGLDVTLASDESEASSSHLAEDNDREDDDDTASETSTVAYDHEPFDIFQRKVAELAAQIFPAASSIRVKRMKGGTYNRVVGLTVFLSKPKKFTKRWLQTQAKKLFGVSHTETGIEYIIRIPRHNGESLERDVAILSAVSSRLSLPLPRVVKYDTSVNNPLKKPYMILTRLQGQNLARVGDELNLDQWRCVAKRVTELVTEIATLTSLSAGDISIDNLSTVTMKDPYLEKFPIPHRGSKLPNFPKPKTWPALPQAPLAMMLEQCERWRELQNIQGFCWEHFWDGFAAISKSLQNRGFLDGPFALVHGDLQPYNLLIHVKDSSTVEITGVLDWDFAVFAPKFVAYRAPFWLWRNEDIDSGDSDAEENVNLQPQEELECELKRVFEDVASEEFKKFAFAPEAMLARRMFAILKDGMFSNYAVQEAEDIIREWSELHPEDCIAHNDSDHESLLPESDEAFGSEEMEEC